MTQIQKQGKNQDARCIPKSLGHSGSYNGKSKFKDNGKEPARRRRYKVKSNTKSSFNGSRGLLGGYGKGAIEKMGVEFAGYEVGVG